MIAAGSLDRVVRIERPATTRNTFGESVPSWTLVAEVPAQVIHLRGKELFAAQQVIPQAEIKVRIRWRSDVDESMRVVFDGMSYGIQHKAEIGRRAGLELLAQKPT